MSNPSSPAGPSGSPGVASPTPHETPSLAPTGGSECDLEPAWLSILVITALAVTV